MTSFSSSSPSAAAAAVVPGQYRTSRSGASSSTAAGGASKRFMAPSGGPVAGPTQQQQQQQQQGSNVSLNTSSMHQYARVPLQGFNSNNSNINNTSGGRFAHLGLGNHNNTNNNNNSNNLASQISPLPNSSTSSSTSNGISAPPSRYLVTVLPPSHLPHDPPHPRTSTFCSGYGPPSKFRRGTLIPLHSTLSGQVGAIAREYGLPSTGGIALYLVELLQEGHTPLSDALVGGPRIGEEAWQLLWGQLFLPPQSQLQQQQDEYDASFSEEDDSAYDALSSDLQHHGGSVSIPSIPPLPPSAQHRHQQQQQYNDVQESTGVNAAGGLRSHSPSEPPSSDVSSVADNSSALASEELLHQNSMNSSNTSHVFSPNSMNSMRYPKSSNTSHSHSHQSQEMMMSSMPPSPHVRPFSSASRGRPRNHPRGHFNRQSIQNPLNSNLHHSNTSRHSLRSIGNRSYTPSIASIDVPGPMYGEAVIVGKIEFDIDNGRGAGRWFDAWLQSANNSNSYNNNNMNAQSTRTPSPLNTPGSTRHFVTRRDPSEQNGGLGSLLRARNLPLDMERQSPSTTRGGGEGGVETEEPAITSSRGSILVEQSDLERDQQEVIDQVSQRSSFMESLHEGVVGGDEQEEEAGEEPEEHDEERGTPSDQPRERSFTQDSLVPNVGHASTGADELPNEDYLTLESTPQQALPLSLQPLDYTSDADAEEKTPEVSLQQVTDVEDEELHQQQPRPQQQADLNADHGERNLNNLAPEASMLSPVQSLSPSQRGSREGHHSWLQDPATILDDSQFNIKSERSSSSSFGHEANIEAMNATPRVRDPQLFERMRSHSPSPTRSIVNPRLSTAMSEQSTTSSVTSSSAAVAEAEAEDVTVPLNEDDEAPVVSDDTSRQDENTHESAMVESAQPAVEAAPELERSMHQEDEHVQEPVQKKEPSPIRDSLTSSAYEDDEKSQASVQEELHMADAQSHHSDASLHSRTSSLSIEAVSYEQHSYRQLDDDEEGDNDQHKHINENENKIDLPDEQRESTVLSPGSGTLVSEHLDKSPTTSEKVEEVSLPYVHDEHEKHDSERASLADADEQSFDEEGPVDLTLGDPLRDIFPSDGNTWAQMKSSVMENDEDSATDSPLEPNVQMATGLGISSSSLLHSHGIPASASSSLDPFEYDNEAADSLNSPLVKADDDEDVKEVSDMLKAHNEPQHFGLSSPINLGEPAKRASTMVRDDTDDAGSDYGVDIISARSSKAHSRAASRTSKMSSQMHSRDASLASLSPTHIALPESDSNRSLSTMAASTSARSLASLASQPSISEPEYVARDQPKMSNRTAHLPDDWAAQLSAFGDIRSRTNSLMEGETKDDGSSLGLPVGELPQFISHLGESSQSRASLASLYAQSSRSRSSSVEMMDNLDEIERALAELSPRALKPLIGDREIGPMPDFASLMSARSLESVPGYSKQSPNEMRAPITPSVQPQFKTADGLPESEIGETKQSLDGPGGGNGSVTVLDETDETSLPAPTDRVSESLSKQSLQSVDSGYMAPPLPLKIRSDKGDVDHSNNNTATSESANTSLDESSQEYSGEFGTPRKFNAILDEVKVSPGQESLASTTIPYGSPSAAVSPPAHRVTFAPEDVREKSTASIGKQGVGSKIATGLKLKGWSNNHKNASKESLHASKEASSPTTSEPAKSPMGGLKGFKWWQKDGQASSSEGLPKTYSDAASQGSPRGPSPTEQPISILSKPNPPFALAPRIPRKSSLASLAAAAKGSLSPSGQPPLSASSNSPAGVPLPHSPAMFPSPPTHTSLPSPQRRPARLPSFMPAYPPQYMVEDEHVQPHINYGPTNGLSPQPSSMQGPSTSPAMVASASLPILSRPQAGGEQVAHLLHTPDMAANQSGRFMGHDGGTSSAPVTPAYAEPSLVSSSGRYGRPSKANPAKAEFRMSADSDLSKMLSHMQAIEFGEEAAATSAAAQANQQQTFGNSHPLRAVPGQTIGLGFGMSNKTGKN